MKIKKSKNNKLKIYSVRTVYQMTAKGKPRVIDRDYDPKATLIEERVVLIKAKNIDEAIRKAEKEAKAYASVSHTNPYGQKVVTRYLNCCDAFELFEAARPGEEVYSCTHLFSTSQNINKLLDAKFGVSMRTAKERSIRTKFLNVEFNAPRRAVRATRR